MNTAEAQTYVLQGWQRLKPLLDSVRELSNDPWVMQYYPPDTAMDNYFFGSIDRFSLLLRVLSQHCPVGARILDAGAGYAMQTAALQAAGYDTYAADVYQGLSIYNELNINYQQWHLEAEKPPFEKDFFDAVILSQTIEHFTYSPLEPIKKLLHTIRPGGYLLIDAPNITSFHNISRLLRGKSIHWGLKKHYLEQQPNKVHGIPYYDRHNHEYSMQDLHDIADYFSLSICEENYYSPVNRQTKSPVSIAFSRIRDVIPHWRKGLFALYQCP